MKDLGGGNGVKWLKIWIVELNIYFKGIKIP